MAQVWVPLEALTQGTLPPVCLLTGVEGAPLRERKLEWVAHPTERGSSMTTPGSVAVAAAVGPSAAVVVSSLGRSPYVAAKVPLTDAALSRMAWTRPLGWAVVISTLLMAIFAAGLTNSLGVFGLGVLLAAVASISFGVMYGRWAGLALVKREGDRVLLDLPNERAAATIEKSFAKSVDGTAHSVG